MIAFAAAAGWIPWLAGCGEQVPLDDFEIARLIQQHPEFKRMRTIRLAMETSGACRADAEQEDMPQRLVALGLIAFRPGSRSVQGKAAAVCRVELSEEARREVNSAGSPDSPQAFSGGANGIDQVAEIPIAMPNYVRLAQLNRTSPDSAEAAFSWQWQPNLIGRKLGMDTRIRNGAATLWLYEGGWRLRSLERGD